ncbi:hypothetical protein [Geomonas azotofigens]|uniref:hypothetical protein n=1 Tax=Geomonas azotofigens TaxID=2843196 RepID=UPI001C0F86C0|nr:hypothetical protein [Geomonas azotofigens]MBU5612637.1 hypothetical protein [Geomonas azotofigens]
MGSFDFTGIDVLDFNEIEKATVSPGLYAWYGKTHIAVPDFKRAVDNDGVDYGEIRLRNSIAKHTLRYQLSPFDLHGKGAFGTKWKGSLDDLSRDYHQNIILGRVNEQEINAKDDRDFYKFLKDVTKNQASRQFLVKVLTAAAPFLTSPIYLGVSKNLKDRLSDHVKLYLSLKEHTSQNDDYLRQLKERILEGGTDFAHRAVAMDFNPEHLFVVTLDMKRFVQSEYDIDTLRKFAGTAEWLLNRWHRPFAGRR